MMILYLLVVVCRSMTTKSKRKKAGQSSELTAAWVDSVSTITISDDDDDEAPAAVNQDDTHPVPAAESDDQPSTVSEKTDAAKPSDMEHSDVKTSEPTNAVDTEPSMEMPVNTGKSMETPVNAEQSVETPMNAEKSVQMMVDEVTDVISPEQVSTEEPHQSAVGNPTLELMDMDEKNSGAEVAVSGLVEFSTGSPSADVAVDDNGKVIDGRSSDDVNKCNTDQVFTTGLFFHFIIDPSYCRSSLYTVVHEKVQLRMQI